MRRVALAVLLGATAICLASSTVVGGPMTITLYPPSVEGLVALELHLAVDGARVATIAARRADVREEPSARFTVAPGFHRYTLTGHVEMAHGRRVPVEGAGALVTREYLTEELASPAARRDPLITLQALIDAHRAVSVRGETLPRLERLATRPPTTEVAAAEARLGVPLPTAYTALLREYGPFTLVEPGDEGGEAVGAALYAPHELLSVPEWRQRTRRAPLEAGDTPRAVQRLALLARDIVVATTLDTGWTVRAGSHPRCPDGQPSLSGEFIFETRPGEDLWNDDTDHHTTYFGDRNARCGDHLATIRSYLTAAFIAGFEKRAATPASAALRPRHDETNVAPGRIRLSFGEYPPSPSASAGQVRP